MTPPLELSSAIESAVTRQGLKPRSDLSEPGWTFWELRTLNMHRAVGLLKDYRKFTDAHDLAKRDPRRNVTQFQTVMVARICLRRRRRVSAIPWNPTDLEPLVNIHESSNGVLQWIVLVATIAALPSAFIPG